MADTTNLKVNFCGVEFENPFLLSSSPVGNHAEMCSRAYDAGWGGIVYKTLNLENSFKVVVPSPRLNAYNSGAHRFIGLQNAEQISDRPIKDNLADISQLKRNYPNKILVASIMGFKDKDWETLAKMTEDVGADMLELNFSCPQMATKEGGHRIGQNYDAIKRYTAVTKNATNLPVMAKMTPNITDMLPVALAAKEGGADAIAAINTIRVITDIDLDTFTPLPNIHGQSGITGFSGTAAKPIGLRFVAELFNSADLKLPISAIGGVTTWKDALHYILLGGTTIQVTSAIMQYGYRIVEDLIEGLSDFMLDRNIKSINDLVGLASKKLVDPADMTKRYQVVSCIDENKCIGCGRCYISCHDSANQAIEFDATTRKPTIDEAKCIGCTLCKHICPVWDCITTKEVDTTITKHAGVID